MRKAEERFDIENSAEAYKFSLEWEVIYMCFHAEAFGCQERETGHCDHGCSCLDI